MLRMRTVAQAAGRPRAAAGVAAASRPMISACRPTTIPSSSTFHTSSRALDQEQKQSEQQERKAYEEKSKEEANKRRSNVTDTPQSPFKVFVQTLKEEIQKNRELQADVQKLQGDVDKAANSEAMKRAREMYERARLANVLKSNPKLAAAAEDMKRAGLKISDGVGEALRAVEESEFMRQLAKTSAAVSQRVSTATAPVRETEAYKALADSITDAFEDSTRYGGYEEKEARRKRRLARAERAGRLNAGKPKRVRVEENPE